MIQGTPDSLWCQQWNEFAYADKAQEAKRLVAGAAAATERDNEREKRRADRAEKKKLNSAWSEKVGKREVRDKRKEKMTRKRKWLKANATLTTAEEPSTTSLKRLREDETGSGDDDDADDWADLEREERMAKKVRKGQVSQKAFDAEFGDLIA